MLFPKICPNTSSFGKLNTLHNSCSIIIVPLSESEENSKISLTQTLGFQPFSVMDVPTCGFSNKNSQGLQMLSLSHHSPSRMKKRLDQTQSHVSAFPGISEMTCGNGLGMMGKVLRYTRIDVCLKHSVNTDLFIRLMVYI